MDEGNYIFKGLFYATGQYYPYQPYGFLSNKMPMSFLIPGWILQFFERGITAPRIYALLVSILFLIGLFLLIRRETNFSFALLGVWVFALNPIFIKTYSLAISQGLVACLFVWSLYFYFGKTRNQIQILIGSLLTSLVVMSRENMIPVIVFLWVYIFVRHRKNLWIAVLASLAPIIFIHILYFPNIMVNWVKWIPFEPIKETLYDWLGVTLPNSISEKVNGPNLFSRITALFEGIKINLWIFLSFLLAIISLLSKRIKDKRFEVLSLSLLFTLLILMHAWASVGKNYCIYCFQIYLSFFNFLGVFIFSLTMYECKVSQFKNPKWVVAGFSLISFIAITFSSYEDMYRSPIYRWLDENFWKFPLPRIKDFRLAEGTMNIKAILINKFDWDIEFALKTLFPIFSVAMIVLIIFFLSYLVVKILNNKRSKFSNPQLWNQMIVVNLLIILLLSPTFLGGNSAYPFQCQPNVIESINAAGQTLARTIEPGSMVDWRSSDSPILMLYLQDIKLHPPQLNNEYSYMNSSDTELVERMGWWNEELSMRWLMESDYLIVSPRDINDDLKLQLQQYYTMAGPSIYLYTCDTETMNLRVYRRNK